MPDLAGITTEDAQRIISAVKMMEKQSGTVLSKPGNASRDSIYAKVLIPVETVEGQTDHKKQATAVEVKFDFNTYTFVEVTDSPIRYDKDLLNSAGATVFDTTNISSKSALSAGQIVELQHYPNLSDDSDWLVVEGGGGGAERPYVVITSVIDAANYVGNVLTSPADSTVVKSAVTIQVPGATSNDYSVGASGFCDLVDDIYYLSGAILG